MTQTPLDAAQPDAQVVVSKTRRRYVPGTGWTSYVPRVLRAAMFFVAVFSIVTALVPPLREYLSGVRDLLELVFIPAPPNITWASGNHLRIRAGQAEAVRMVVPRRRRGPGCAGEPAVGHHRILACAGQFGTDARDPHPQPQGVLRHRPQGQHLAGAAGSRHRDVDRDPDRLAPGRGTAGYGAASDRWAYAAHEVLGGLGTRDFTEIQGNATRPVPLLLGLLGTAVYVYFGLTLFRSRDNNVHLSADDEVQIRTLLAQSGERDSLGYFATRRDKSVVWSTTRKAAVTYRVVNSVSLASGDPIGDPESWPQAIESWLEESRHYGWAPAAMGAGEEGAQAYVRAGLQALSLGDEAIIEFKDFTLEGRHMRVVRQAVNKLERDGFTTRVRRHRDIPDDHMAGVIADADRWRDTDNERGFSMALGRLGDPLDGDCVLTEIYDPEGNRCGLLSFSPWGQRGISLDLMRRDHDAENGVMEMMVTATVAAGPR